MPARLQPRKPNPLWVARLRNAENHQFVERYLRKSDRKLKMSSEKMTAAERLKANKEQRRLDWVAFYAQFYL